jgi:hypothetical protein
MNKVQTVFILIIMMFQSCNHNTTSQLIDTDSIEAINAITDTIATTTLRPFDSHKYNLDEKDSMYFSLTEITESYFDQYASESGEGIVADKNFEKKSNEIKLLLTSGKYYTRKDTGVSDGSSDSYIKYNYLGTLNSIGQYYIVAEEYETIHTYLVNQADGKENETGRDPILSPQRKWILSFENIYDSEGSDDLSINLLFDQLVNGNIIADNTRSVTLYYQNNKESFEGYPDSEEVCWEKENIVLLKLTFKGNDNDTYSDYLRVEVLLND